MEMDKPTWLDASFVQRTLQEAEKDESIEVSSMSVKPAAAEGDNYASDVHRVIVELSRIDNGYKIAETRSLIAKVAPQGGDWEEMITRCGVFGREMSVMMEILPIMNQMLAKFSTTSLAPRCLRVQYENPKYLIIEDLAPREFRMAERRACLDLDHCILGIRSIAAFHAASVALAEKDPQAITKYEHEVKYEYKTASFYARVNECTKVLGEEVANWPELSPRISEKILKLSEVIWKKRCEASLVLQDDFNVLNHGDCTLSNMLFRYDEQRKPIGQIFVDFQLVRYGSPAIDILTFFGTSPSVDVRFDDRELLMREYHDALTSTMAKLKCSTKTPSFDHLRDILRKRAFFEVLPSFTTLPHAIIDTSEAKDLDDLGEKHEHPAYRGKMYRKIMSRVLPFYDSFGLLDL